MKTPTSQQQRKPRAQLKHVLFDVGFKDKPVMINLESEFSPLARLLYMDLQAAMSAATNGLISRKVARVLGSRIGLEAGVVDAIVAFCLESGMLLLENDMLTSARVIKDQESLALEQERWRRKREKSEAASPAPAGASEVKARKCEDLYIEDLNFEDLKDLKETVRPPGSLGFQPDGQPDITLPEAFERPDVRDALKLWAQKLSTKGRKLDQIQVDALCMRFRDRVDFFVKSLIFSCSLSTANNVIEAPANANSPPKETFLEIARRLDREEKERGNKGTNSKIS